MTMFLVEPGDKVRWVGVPITGHGEIREGVVYTVDEVDVEIDEDNGEIEYIEFTISGISSWWCPVSCDFQLVQEPPPRSKLCEFLERTG
jgi:hypothetical protein